MSVQEIKIHPWFDINSITYDYAIVRTVKDIDFTYGANAACLPGVKDPKLTDGNLGFMTHLPVRDIKKTKPRIHQFTNLKFFKMSFKAFKMKKKG